MHDTTPYALAALGSTGHGESRMPRRAALKSLAAWACSAPELLAAAENVQGDEPFFLTRGIVLVIDDLRTLDWPERAKRSGLNTIATHIFPHQVAQFIRTDRGQVFLESCRKLHLQVEHELHAMSDLLPRRLFDKDPTMFPMNEQGNRVRQFNLCIHSETALSIACENAVKYSRLLRPSTGRYFYWIDDGQPMCRCPQCRGLTDSDQALVLENRLLEALRREDPRAKLAHLAYARTLRPPTHVKPNAGIFLEFAPITRRYDVPLGQRDARPPSGPSHGELLDVLDANLAVFGREGAQALEYWLDLSRFSGWRRANVRKLPWNRDVFLADLGTYAQRGIRHVTSFGAWLDGDYVKRFGDPPVDQYGGGMLRWRFASGKPFTETKT